MREQIYAQQSASLIWRRRVIALGTFAATVVAVVIITAATLGGGGGGRGGGGGGSAVSALASLAAHPVSVSTSGHLVQPVAQAAGVPGGASGAMLALGGLGGGGLPIGAIQRVVGPRVRVVGQLPLGLRAAGAAQLANMNYLFGGAGQGGAPRSAILGVRADGEGGVREVGALPEAVTDPAVAAIGGTAFVFGGFDGSRDVDVVVAWRPGGRAHRTAHLPRRLRSAAAVSVGGRAVIIVGGLSGGVPSRTILRFDPDRHRVRAIGQLPVALAHSGLGTLGGLVFAIGGRGAGPGSETRAIYAIDPTNGRVRFAGSLPVGLADPAVVTVSGRILVAGGIARSGSVQNTVFEVSLPPGR